MQKISRKRGLPKQRRRNKLEKIKLYYDAKGSTLTIWLDDPSKEDVAEELGDGVIVMKDKTGNVIGIEKLGVHSDPRKKVEFDFEAVAA